MIEYNIKTNNSNIKLHYKFLSNDINSNMLINKSPIEYVEDVCVYGKPGVIVDGSKCLKKY